MHVNGVWVPRVMACPALIYVGIKWLTKIKAIQIVFLWLPCKYIIMFEKHLSKMQCLLVELD